MFQYNCLNPIAQIGLDYFDGNYEKVEDVNAAQGILVRSASMHEMEFSDNLLAAVWQLLVVDMAAGSQQHRMCINNKLKEILLIS